MISWQCQILMILDSCYSLIITNRFPGEFYPVLMKDKHTLKYILILSHLNLMEGWNSISGAPICWCKVPQSHLEWGARGALIFYLINIFRQFNYFEWKKLNCDPSISLQLYFLPSSVQTGNFNFNWTELVLILIPTTHPTHPPTQPDRESKK